MLSLYIRFQVTLDFCFNIRYIQSIFLHLTECECKICGKQFPNAAKYAYHARAHDPTKQFCCKFCDKKFIQHHHLQNHERTHTGLKPFLCNICGSRFKQECNFKLHLRVHANDRRYTCTICPKGN